MDHCGRDEKEDLRTDIQDYSMRDSNCGCSLARRQPPTLNDVHSSKPSTPLPPPRPLSPDSVSLSTSQHNLAAVYQPAMKEEEPHSEEAHEQQPSHPPAPKVTMSLRDFALRKKKQREKEMTKNVQDTPSSSGVDMSFGGSEGGGVPNGIQANLVVEESRNRKAVELKENPVDSYQGALTLSRNVLKDEVVDVSGTSTLRSMASTTHSHHHRHLLVPHQSFAQLVSKPAVLHHTQSQLVDLNKS